MAAYTEHAEWARIYGDLGTGIWLAPEGTDLPEGLELDPGAPFVPSGWLEDSGIEMETSKDQTKINALQGGTLIKQRVGKVEKSISFTTLEDSALVAELAYMNKVEVTGGIAKQEIGLDQARSARRVMLVDAVEGNVVDRHACALVEVTFTGTVKLADLGGVRAHKFEATPIGSVIRITNSPGMLAVA